LTVSDSHLIEVIECPIEPLARRPLELSDRGLVIRAVMQEEITRLEKGRG
jgi:hypothetical protein